MIREAVTSDPLYWPPGWKRTGSRERSRFGRSSVYAQTQKVLNELALMSVWDWNVIISTNVNLRRDGLPYSNRPAPSDPGVAVWFTIRDEERVLASDRWDRVEDNLKAIAKHIGAMRGQDRWGVGSLEQAFRGYTALPAVDEPKDWRDVLGFSRDDIVDRHRELAMQRHPDTGGFDDAFAKLSLAYGAGILLATKGRCRTSE